MMTSVTLHAVETVLSFAVFVGILLWAYSSRRKAAFDQLAMLPFDDEARPESSESSTPSLTQSSTGSSPISAERGHV